MAGHDKRETWRLFIAVPVSEEARARISAVSRELSASNADAKWSDPANFHLTLAFLGQTPPGRLAEISSAMERAAAKAKAFSLRFDRLGSFPADAPPKVVWLGAGEGAAALKALAEPLVQELSALGLVKADEAGRLFEVHLTLARVRGMRGLRRLRALVKSQRVEPFETPVARLILYRSHPEQDGPHYEELAEAKLS